MERCSESSAEEQLMGPEEFEKLLAEWRLFNTVIISGTSHYGLARKIAEALGKPCYFPKIYRYPTGDFELALNCNVRGRIVFIIQSFPPQPERVFYYFLETCFLVNTAYKSSAAEVNLIVPHLGWDQSDKKWRGRMPIAGELIAAFFHWAGAKRYIGLQFHSPSFPGFFPLPAIVDHLVADQLLVNYILSQKLNKNAILLPGDLGFARSARRLAEKLNVKMYEVEKERRSAHEVKIHKIYGNVKGKNIIIWDDKIVEGTTIRTIVEYLNKKGAKRVIVVATHGLFSGNVVEQLTHKLIQKIIVTDSIPHSRYLFEKLPLVEISVAPLLASAIKEIITPGGSVSKLFEGSAVQWREREK